LLAMLNRINGDPFAEYRISGSFPRFPITLHLSM
jgi:hypothetical protein